MLDGRGLTETWGSASAVSFVRGAQLVREHLAIALSDRSDRRGLSRHEHEAATIHTNREHPVAAAAPEQPDARVPPGRAAEEVVRNEPQVARAAREGHEYRIEGSTKEAYPPLRSEIARFLRELPTCALEPRARYPRAVGIDERREQLLARRVPREQVVLGRAYVIHARNGGVGVAVERDGQLGYCLHREKLGQHYAFVELDWDEGPPHGTAIPLSAIDEEPPAEEDGPTLLAWLTVQEELHREAIEAAWEVLLGFRPPRAPAPSTS